MHFFYPRGGWHRAARYVAYRLRRLPDPAHKISRGIAAGVFVSFTPLFGTHFFLAAILAWMMRGNVLAALLATFFGNPLTFPLIAAVSVETGSWILGRPPVPLTEVVGAFTFASLELWANIVAIFTPAQVAWGNLAEFMRAVFLPYLVGGLFPGLVTAAAAYFLANPVIASYQRGRIARLKLRFEKRRRAIEAARAAKAEKAAEAYEAERVTPSE